MAETRQVKRAKKASLLSLAFDANRAGDGDCVSFDANFKRRNEQTSLSFILAADTKFSFDFLAVFRDLVTFDDVLSAIERALSQANELTVAHVLGTRKKMRQSCARARTRPHFSTH